MRLSTMGSPELASVGLMRGRKEESAGSCPL
jgi:hypothetical protein